MKQFWVICGGCGAKIRGRLQAPSTLSCQSCGSQSGKIVLESGDHNAVLFSCCKCEKKFILKAGVNSSLKCPVPSCNWMAIKPEETLSVANVVSFKDGKETRKVVSKDGVKILEEDPISDFIEPEDLQLAKKSHPTLKLTIPYFNGGPRIERAIKTWIYPEVVFALVDEGIVPPGHGVCGQIFTPKNSLSEGVGTKTRPFVLDIIKKTLEIFPNQDYYGYFNSDIILPPGTPIKSLLPSKNKKIVFHHRVDMEGGDTCPISKLKKRHQVYVGKDGFIGEKEVIETILKEMKDMILGGAAWDDGILVWCWQKFGTDRVELRYGEILHSIHRQVWNADDVESRFNRKALIESGVKEEFRTSIGWMKVKDIENKPKKIRELGIIQPGRIGDIIIVLPIAKWYHDLGFKIVWPVCHQYMPLFDYVSYVEPIDIGQLSSNSYKESVNVLKNRDIDEIIDLGIGFGKNEEAWVKSGLSFDRWKYNFAHVPFEERFNLQINRNYQKELDLQKKLGLLSSEDNYYFTHSIGSKGRVHFDVPEGTAIEGREEDGFTVFDWIGIIEKARYVFCVDSCFAHIVNQLGLAKGRRSFQPLSDYLGRPGPIPAINWKDEQIVFRNKKAPPKKDKVENVLLVSLPSTFHTGDWPLYPMGIGYLLSSLQKDRDASAIHFQKIEHYEEMFNKVLLESNPDLVGFTCTTFNRGNVKRAIERVRSIYPKTKIVVGGVHASFLPSQMIKNYGADYVVIGEGENTIRYLCRAIEGDLSFKDVKGIAYCESKDAVIVNDPSPHIEDLDTLPFPDYSFVEQIIKDSGLGCIITSRGCPARCNYCSTSHYWGQKIRAYSPDRVIEEIEFLVDRYGIEKLFFHDDTINFSEERLKEICRKMIEKNFNLTWACHGRVHPISQEMIDLMVQAGCRHVCWGIESGSASMLKKMNKRIDLEHVKKAYDLCLKHKEVMTTGAFTMVGYPGESEQTIQETCEFLKTLSMTDNPSSSVLYVLPGTKVCEEIYEGVGEDHWLMSDDVYYNTSEHSLETLHNWADRVNKSVNLIPFDKSKHFWDQILIGKIPPPKLPIFKAQKKILNGQSISSR